MTQGFTEDVMRARFHELGALREAKLAISGPMRAERDARMQALEAQLAAVRAEYSAGIQAAEDGLFDIDQERARLVRALNGKTGEPPTV